MRIGYARISNQEQNLELQTDALKAADCERIFMEKASGAQRDRQELTAALGHLRAGDALVVWKLDRLARSLKQLIETVEALDYVGDTWTCHAENFSRFSLFELLRFNPFSQFGHQ